MEKEWKESTERQVRVEKTRKRSKKRGVDEGKIKEEEEWKDSDRRRRE